MKYFKGTPEADTMLAKKVAIRSAGLKTEKQFFGPRGVFAKAGHTGHLKGNPHVSTWKIIVGSRREPKVIQREITDPESGFHMRQVIQKEARAWRLLDGSSQIGRKIAMRDGGMYPSRLAASEGADNILYGTFPEHPQGGTLNPGAEWAKEVANSLNIHLPVPYRHAYTSTLGGPERASVLLTVSMDPRETWINSILENSRYAKFHINDGVIELISKHGLPSFRKSRFKDTQGLFDVLQKWIRAAGQSEPRKNPITLIGAGNPKPKPKAKANPAHRINAGISGVLYNRCVEIRAEKTAAGKLKGFYYHPFKRDAQVCILALDNGDLLIHSKAGKQLWKVD